MAFHRRQKASRAAGMSETEKKTVAEVRKIAADNGLCTSPIDLIGLLEVVGIRLIKEPMDAEVSGYLERRDEGWVIGVNSLHHPRRQRFTIAHELGHYFRHGAEEKSFSDRAFWRNQESNPLEWEANRFAGELLIPEPDFRRLVAQGTKDIDDLARHFHVSAPAVKVRAKQLGYNVRESQ